MSGEREARAVGAGETIEVEGRTYTLRPVAVQHLCDATREALRYHKRQHLETFSDNKHLLGDRGDEVLVREMTKVAGWTIKDLPQVDAYSAKNVPVTKAACDWAKEQFGADCDPDVEEDKARVRGLLATALDKGMVTADEIAEMCDGKRPVCGKVRFDSWWSTATDEGMICFVHSSVKRDHPDVKREDVAAWPPAKLIEAARLVESVTSVDLGNG